MHHIVREIDKYSKKMNCNNQCKNYEPAFEHRHSACVLSDVYSTSKGQPCAIHSMIGDIPIKQE